VFSNGKKRLIS